MHWYFAFNIKKWVTLFILLKKKKGLRLITSLLNERILAYVFGLWGTISLWLTRILNEPKK